MGVIGRILGGPSAVTALGTAARDVAEVFTVNATRREELSAQAQTAALSQLSAEYAQAGLTWFDRAVNGLNRLPRPMLAFGTLALFSYAMVDPDSFSQRMIGLNHVPEPLWWLLGAVVGFYFGAREAHYFRSRPVAVQEAGAILPPPSDPLEDDAEHAPMSDDGSNPALEEWRRTAD